MGKYYGKIGYGISEETSPGVWVDSIETQYVYGDIYKNVGKNEKSENLNNNINISMQLSFIANPYARLHFHLIKYVEYMGTKWNVNSVTEEYPRLSLILGGVYNGT